MQETRTELTELVQHTYLLGRLAATAGTDAAEAIDAFAAISTMFMNTVETFESPDEQQWATFLSGFYYGASVAATGAAGITE